MQFQRIPQIDVAVQMILATFFIVTAGFQSAITKLSIAQNIYIVFMTSTQINSCPLLLTSYVIDTIR